MTRTLPMWLVAAANAMLAVAMALVLVVFVLPELDQPETATFLPIIVAFIVAAVVAGLAAAAWPGALRRSWVWLAAGLPPTVALLMFLPFITYDLSHPQSGVGYVAALLTVAGAALAATGGIAAFQQVRSGATGPSSAPTRAAVAVLAGLVAGSIATSLVASASGGGAAGAVAGTPTTTLVVRAAQTKFDPTELSLGASETLGLFVVNEDDFGHSFDIDELDIHVALPANSTTAIVIKPTAAGAVRFYCAIPGHAEAGMVGTLTVD
ncbi:MAG TPA: cupredoxin domain-containing protein [Candidatus Binatia bacterium]|nr:cupredoxin domain-containing protein [Candidatus Binatia bacterium]